ncbi:hypothetical protein Gotur_026198 [Gossypium turneri]
MVLIRVQLLNRELVMENEFLDKVEDNAAICFTFGKVDLVPTVEEYTPLLRYPEVQVDKAYYRAANDLILVHLDTKKRVDVFALSIYGLVIFSKALGHVDDAVSDLFDQLDKMVTPDFDWVPLLGIWGAIGYTPLLVLRQYRSSQESTQPIEEHLQVIPFELKIVKQDFEKKNSKLGKMIENLEEEKIHLGLDVDVQKLEAKKMRKGKNKAEEDLDSLQKDYKKLCLSIRIAGLGKTSEKWRQEIQEEKIKAD